MYTDDGIINLAIAIIEQAVEDYQNHLDVCNDLQARLCAKADSNGILGYILGYATGDKDFLVKEVEKKISSQLERSENGRR